MTEIMEPTDAQGPPQKLPPELPLLLVEGLVLLPLYPGPVVVDQPADIAAVDAALEAQRTVAVVTRKPAAQEHYDIGTAAGILRMLRMPDETRRVLLQGLSRIRIIDEVQRDGYLVARVVPVEEEPTPQDAETQALGRALLDNFRKIAEMNPALGGEAQLFAINIQDPARLADFVAATIIGHVEERQAVLEAVEPKERLRRAIRLTQSELEVLEQVSKIQTEARSEMERSQREYLLRQQLRAIQKELGEQDPQQAEIDSLREQVAQAAMPEEARKAAERELDRLSGMPPAAAEYTVARTYLDWLINMPWQKSTEDVLDVERAQRVLDEDHYDLEKVKERIIEFLAVRKLRPQAHGPILCFAGPPGTGKTSLGRSIARALGREFLRISLGGMRDEAEIRGHRRTYVGALPGRIIQGLRRAGVNNPVFMLDEVDKIGADFRGDPAAALLEVLDPEQNNSFRDHYLEVAFDLSRVMFITTGNVLFTIPPALRDRMEVIPLSGYSQEEKVSIAKRYLIPRQIEENGLTAKLIGIPDAALRKIIRQYTREAGLRNLERSIGSVCRKVAREVAAGKKKRTVVRAADVPSYLGPPAIPEEEKTRRPELGVAVGMAWTETGGETLRVEATRMEGERGLNLTGQLGDVMKESVAAALTYVRANAKKLGIEPNFFENSDLHVHVPAGAIPKDGPSAGVTMAAALASLLSGRACRQDTAMTGEITLRGRVLPVGGVREKVLGARREGIRRLVLPQANESDAAEIPEHLRKDMEFIFARRADEVLEAVLVPAHEGKAQKPAKRRARRPRPPAATAK